MSNEEAGVGEGRKFWTVGAAHVAAWSQRRPQHSWRMFESEEESSLAATEGSLTHLPLG